MDGNAGRGDDDPTGGPDGSTDGTDGPVRTYYAAIDDGAYDRLREALAPDFVQERSDRTLDGRERFVRFMRDERPRTDTTHAVDSVCACEGEGTEGREGPTREVFVRGRLLTDGGEKMFGFVDVHRVAGGRIERLATYTR